MGQIADRERAAWNLVLDGAQSHLDDWIDEDGEYTEEEFEDIRERTQEIVTTLRLAVRYPGIRAQVWE